MYSQVGDLGLSRVMSAPGEYIQSSPYFNVLYASPEVLLEGKMMAASDVYAFGVILW